MKKVLLILLALTFILGVFTGCKSKTDQNKSTTTGDEQSNPPQTDPGKLPESVEVGEIRVQLLSERLIRIEVKGPKGFEDRPSYTVTKRRNWDEVKYSASTGEGHKIITTSAYKVYIPENAKNMNGIYITDVQGKELWRYETNTNSNVYMPSPSDELNSWYFTDAPRIIPAENGYSVMDEYEKYNGWDFSNDALDTFVFLPQGSYENFTSDFVKLTGSSELVTLKMLGYWDSRWFTYNSTTALKQIQDYLDRGYSIDVLVIDTDWRTTENGVGYNINKSLFPDMADFLEKAHEMGVSIVFNDHPEPQNGTNNLLDEKEVEYRNKNLKLILSLGLDYWWYDRNWSVALKPIDNDVSIYASGMYAFQWITEDYYNSITDIDEYARRALIMANVDGIMNGVLQYAPELSAHRYSIQWTGDIDCEVSDLEDEIFNAVYGGAELGIPYVSADIGGHRTEVSNDMYVRWMQFGALSPICRVHCTKPFSRMPWIYGETAEAVTHMYVNMRYRLLPLYYALAHENYETGLPLLKRLDILYPQYAEADANDEYLLGDTLLIAPLAEGYSVSEDTYFTSNDQKGLYAEYFSNRNLSGDPTVTRYEENINFNWDQGSPDGISVVDNFSVRWTGQIHIGKDDCILRFFADDGIRVWIDDVKVIDGWGVYDQYFTTDPLEAGSTHTIKIEYFDSGSYAHIYSDILTNEGVSRDVFLPEGEWMDVWTGKTFVGPATITVTHRLETSPIFIRMGTVLALADNMSNTGEKDWSHLTLDIYPSTSFDSSVEVYEDDTETVAYKDGKYRKTEITMNGSAADNTVTLTVNPAQGTFEGSLAFTERSWTVRIHGRSDWGALKSVTLDGKSLTFKKINKDDQAEPLAIQGGARDNVIYECSFSAPVTSKSTLVLTFESTIADKINENYDKTSANFDIDVQTLTKANTAPNLTSLGNKDWAVFGAIAVDTVIRKNTENHYISDLTGIGSNYAFSDNYKISWQDGEGIHGIGSTTNGPVSNHSFEVALKVNSDKTHYQIYLGGYRSLAKITIRDRAGNVRTFTFGDMDTNYYRMVTIECSSDTESELYVTYSLLCGDNITFSAITASDGNVEDVEPPADIPVTDSIVDIQTPYSNTFDLTAEGTTYWEYYGPTNCSKAESSDIINTVFDGGGQAHFDNKAIVKWSDGANTVSKETREGYNASGITVKVTTAGCSSIKLLAGAWNATNLMTLYNADNDALECVNIVSGGSVAQMAVVTIDISKYEGDTLTIRFDASESNGGNISLTAVTVS